MSDIFGFVVVLTDALPPGELRFVNADRETVGRIMNLMGTKEGSTDGSPDSDGPLGLQGMSNQLRK